MQEIEVKLDNEHWYKLVPKLSQTSRGGKVTILWDQQVQTNRTIPNNKPEITRIICDNKNGTHVLIDVAISGDSNMIKKETEKFLIYKYFTTEVQRMWNVKTKAIPVKEGDWNHLKIIQKIPEQHT
jgi:hypothetical protein